MDTNDEKVVGKHHSFGEVQDEGFDQSHFGGIAKGHLGLRDFSLGFEILVTSKFPEPLRTSQKNVLGRSLERIGIVSFMPVKTIRVRSTHLRKEESQEESGSTGEPQHDPECPSPTIGLNSKSRDDRSKTGSTGSGNSPDTKGESPRLDRVHVLQRGSTSSEGRRTEESSKETKDTESGKVGDESRRDLKNDENDQGDHVRRVSSNCWNLGQRRPKKRSGTAARIAVSVCNGKNCLPGVGLTRIQQQTRTN